jgi:hypothetical protein
VCALNPRIHGTKLANVNDESFMTGYYSWMENGDNNYGWITEDRDEWNLTVKSDEWVQDAK